MTTPDHTPANKLIAAMFNPGVVGFSDKQEILRVDIELLKESDLPNKVRSVCIGADETIIDVAEAPSIVDLCAWLGRQFAISWKYVTDRYEFVASFEKRFMEGLAWNDAQKESWDDMSQFTAEDVIYSVTSNAPYRVVWPNKPDDYNEGFFVAYAQRKSDPNPDTCLIEEACFSNMFDAMVWVRNRIEKSIIAAFMPEVKL